MLLSKGANAIRWQADTVAISAVPWAALIVIVYTPNPVTGLGYWTYQPGDTLSNMKLFVQGYDYLVVLSDSYTLLDGTAGAADASFAGIAGYTPPTPDTAPLVPVGRTETGYAGEPIITGRLVAQTPGGLLHYSSAIWSHEHLLFGVALNSALAGGAVSVRRPGYVHIPGWGLPPNQLLLAGSEGKLVVANPPLNFYQVIGRSLGSDTLIYQPEDVILLPTNPQP